MDLLLTKEHDLMFINGECPVTRPPVSTEDVLEVVGQRLKIRLLTFQGEYDLNTELGVPWFQRVLTRGVSKSQIDNILREQILLDEGVAEITEFESTLVRGVYTLRFKATTDTGRYVTVDNLQFSV